MEFAPIRCYEDFLTALRGAGFSMGGSSENIFSLCDHFAENIRWHTGDPETDPWVWRRRAVEEGDIAYGKFFFHKGGYITREWLPLFMAVRRDGLELVELYEDGAVSRMEKDAYEMICGAGRISFSELKSLLAVRRESASRFESACVSLQNRMFITICGETRKRSAMGEPYGWPVNVFCPIERAFDGELWEDACGYDAAEAEDILRRRILELNPAADEKVIRKFIRG
ncbi:MAG: hypothetical protein IKM31_09590 [Oscillospiraceae bacterium]|nr:hypothetical protein [Oscillospiraceae bacterium]